MMQLQMQSMFDFLQKHIENTRDRRELKLSESQCVLNDSIVILSNVRTLSLLVNDDFEYYFSPMDFFFANPYFGVLSMCSII